MKMMMIPALLLLIAVAMCFADDVGHAGGARVSGDFTVLWEQRVDDPAATTQPAIRIGEFAIDLRPAPKAKPKDPPAFNVTLGSDTARSKTRIYPGKTYHFAVVGMAGKVQLFVNGFPDGQAITPPTPPVGPLRIDGAQASAPPKNVLLQSKPLTANEIVALFKEKIPAGREILTTAHRGINRYAPENTRISYVQSVEAGAPVVEFDTALTKDGHIVGLHDKTVDRTTNGTGKIAELTLEQARKLEAGAWKDAKYKGEPIPTLDEVAEVVRGKAVLMLDLKAEGQGAAVAKWLEASKFPHDQLILAPWEDAEGVALRRHVPADVPMIRLTSKVPTEVIDDAYFEKMKSIGFSGFSVNWQYLTQDFVRTAQKNGMMVYTWTLNDAPDLAGAAMLGVDGIVTDDSAATIKLLAALAKK